MRTRVTAVLIALACSPALVVGGEERSFGESTSVVVVEVPVNVVRDGSPVRGLSEQNFVVLDRGVRRPLTGFEVVDLSSPEASTREDSSATGVRAIPVVARRHFLLLFNLHRATPDALGRSIAAARDLIEAGLHPSDIVAVGIYGEAAGARLLLSFTPDRRQVVAVLDALEGLLDRQEEGEEEGAGQADPLGLVAPNELEIANDVRRALGVEEGAVTDFLQERDPIGGRSSAVQTETLLEMAAFEEQGLRERRRAELGRMAMSLADLARQSSGVDGRKYLLLFSTSMEAAADEEGSAVVLAEIDRAVEEFRRSGWSVQVIDPSRSGAGSLLADQAGLSTLARQTGGEVFRNFGRLGGALADLMRRSSVTYLLAFQADGLELDGSFHPIRVRLRGVPGRPKLLHREGYYADPLASETSGGRLRVADLLLGEGDLPGMALMAMAVPIGSAGDATRIAVVASLEPRLGRNLAAGSFELELFGYAFDEGGGIADFFGRRFHVPPRSGQWEATAPALRVVAALRLAPGIYSLKLLARNPTSAEVARLTVPLTVPSAAADDLLLGPPLFVSDSPGTIATIRRSADGEAMETYPFQAGGERFVPQVRPRVPQATWSRVCVMMRDVDSARTTFSARILDAAGNEMDQARLELLGSEPREGSDGWTQLYLGMGAEMLAEGSYRLEVSLYDESSGRTLRETTAFYVDSS